MNPRKFVMARYNKLQKKFEADGKTQRELIAFVIFVSCVAVIVSSLAVWFILNFKQAIVYIHDPFPGPKPVVPSQVIEPSPSPTLTPSVKPSPRSTGTNSKTTNPIPHTSSKPKPKPKPTKKPTKNPQPTTIPTIPSNPEPPKNPQPTQPEPTKSPNLLTPVCDGVLNPVLGTLGTKCSDLGLG